MSLPHGRALFALTFFMLLVAAGPCRRFLSASFRKTAYRLERIGNSANTENSSKHGMNKPQRSGMNYTSWK